jgi:hypothetical protein
MELQRDLGRQRRLRAHETRRHNDRHWR